VDIHAAFHSVASQAAIVVGLQVGRREPSVRETRNSDERVVKVCRHLDPDDSPNPLYKVFAR